MLGVTDYDSLVQLLTDEFRKVLPEYGATDPQNMIQLMAATIRELRRGQAA